MMLDEMIDELCYKLESIDVEYYDDVASLIIDPEDIEDILSSTRTN